MNRDRVLSYVRLTLQAEGTECCRDFFTCVYKPDLATVGANFPTVAVCELACLTLSGEMVAELRDACLFLFPHDLVDEPGAAMEVFGVYAYDVLGLAQEHPRLMRSAVAATVANAAIQLAQTSSRMFPKIRI